MKTFECTGCGHQVTQKSKPTQSHDCGGHPAWKEVRAMDAENDRRAIEVARLRYMILSLRD